MSEPGRGAEDRSAAEPVRLGIVGGGWRADFFARLAGLLPHRLHLVGAAVQTAHSAERVGRAWGVPVHLSPAELLRAGRPELVVTSVPRSVNPDLLGELVAAGVHVLSETPPAEDEAALGRLWDRVGDRELVHVAEQYPSMPTHRARLEVVRLGLVGRPTSVHISSTHDYHAVALARRYLGVGRVPATVSSAVFRAPLVNPLRRAGWTDDPEPKEAATVLATIDFGDASALYDFTDNQWHNRLRHRRLVVRGSTGEICDDDVVALTGPRTITTSTIRRSQLGHDLNLDGHDTEHLSLGTQVLYRNPWAGLRLMDEEIAIATVLDEAARWARDEGPGPYPLAEACHDHLVSLAIHRSAATGAPVRTGKAPWGA